MIYAESRIRSPHSVRGRHSSARRICCRSRMPSLNLVVSGLALHRVNDLPGALVQIRRALCPDGLFLAALLGVRSLIELREALIEAEAEGAGRREPARRAVRRCQGLRRAVAADGLCAAGGRRRRAEGALRLAPRTDARGASARRRQCPVPSAARRRCPRRTLDRAEAIYRERHALPGGGVARPLRSSIYRDGGPMRASRSRFRRAAPRRASPTLSARPSARPATRHLSPWASQDR